MADILVVLIIVLVVVLAFRGPRMLPKLGEAFGRGVKDARQELGALKDKDPESGDGPAS